MVVGCSAGRFSKFAGVVLVFLAAWLLGPSLGLAAAPVAEVEDPEGVVASVERLIADLGARQFVLRERAQAELQRLGLAAFDALHEAQDSDDIEIAIRSRYLLRSLDLRWARDDDPPPVRLFLRGYGDKPLTERQNLLVQLAALNDGQGIGALCRIVRFDDSNLLSKRAALAILQQPAADDPAAGQQIHHVILLEIGPSQRVAATWLRRYLASHDDPEALLDASQEALEREESVFRQTPELSAADILRDLLRWQAGLLERLQRDEQALALIQRTLDLLDGTREQLLETVEWLIRREAWPLIQQVAERFSEQFNESSILLYRLAEAHLKQDRAELAEQTAEQALKLNEDSHQEHILAAYSLQQRGLFDWAQREYRHVLDLGPAGSQHDLQARFLLSEMLHDLGRNLDAAQTLQPAVDAMDADQNVQYLARRMGREPGSIRSRMHYFYGEDLRSHQQYAEQRQRLEQGVQQDATDADLLIAMYRASSTDEAWRMTTRDLIRSATETFRQQIRSSEQAVASASSEEIRSIYNRQLAGANNQLAWLVSNTEGDYDEALRCSQRSLELRPKTAAYLDTLAHCYFAKGEYAKAVQAQLQAVELEPFSHQIRRQLEVFEQAHRKASEDGEDSPTGRDQP
jgi:tetratricopeptide (TPR) repeat protein